MKHKKIISIASALVFLFNTYSFSKNVSQTNDILTVSASEISETQPRPTIKKITATCNSATIKWNKIQGAQNYTVYMASSGTGWKEIATVNGTSYTVKSLTPATPYYFVIRARINGLLSDYSECKDTITPTKAPAVKKISTTSFSGYFKFSASDKAFGYQAQVRTANGSWVTKTVYINNNEFMVSGLSANKKYYLRMRSYITDGGGVKHYSAYSKTISFKTQKKITMKSITTKASVGSSQIAVNTKKVCSRTQDKNCAQMINYLRKDLGLNTLVWDETLYKVAMERSKEITSNYSHVRPDGTSCFTISLAYDGENIVPRKDVYTAYMAWYHSPSHYENMTYPNFKRIAVAGVYYRGNYYLVTAFGY